MDLIHGSISLRRMIKITIAVLVVVSVNLLWRTDSDASCGIQRYSEFIQSGCYDIDAPQPIPPEDTCTSETGDAAQDCGSDIELLLRLADPVSCNNTPDTTPPEFFVDEDPKFVALTESDILNNPRKPSGGDIDTYQIQMHLGNNSFAAFADLNGYDHVSKTLADKSAPLAGKYKRNFAACGSVTTMESGYYDIYNKVLAESCDDQVDESGYLTIHNSCNLTGKPAIASRQHSNDYRIYLDADNQRLADNSVQTCQPGDDETCDSQFGASFGRKMKCNHGNHGRCCVPAEPTYLGTFYLRAGEPNRICLHSLCGDYLQKKLIVLRESRSSLPQDALFALMVDPAAVLSADEIDKLPETKLLNRECLGPVANSSSPERNVDYNSIHFQLGSNAVACKNDTIREHTFGCENPVDLETMPADDTNTESSKDPCLIAAEAIANGGDSPLAGKHCKSEFVPEDNRDLMEDDELVYSHCNNSGYCAKDAKGPTCPNLACAHGCTFGRCFETDADREAYKTEIAGIELMAAYPGIVVEPGQPATSGGPAVVNEFALGTTADQIASYYGNDNTISVSDTTNGSNTSDGSGDTSDSIEANGSETADDGEEVSSEEGCAMTSLSRDKPQRRVNLSLILMLGVVLFSSLRRRAMRMS